MRIALGVLLLLLCGCNGLYMPTAEDRRKPLAEARDRLLGLHPDWQPMGSGWDNSFFHRGYLVTNPDFREPKGNETHAVLDQAPSVINSRNDLAGLDESKWRGAVYGRRLHSGRKEETPGWHGERVLIRNDCLFFGDKEMLKTIDEDLR